ncbi:MAG: hypothetical protein GX361_00245 [Bacteroidales bacterium]|nr:hypothetical protein [Bacteroidales bacterium]
MLRLDVSQYTEPVDLLFYYLPAKANRSDRYTRREINRMTDIEYVAKLENVKPSRTEFSEAVDIPLRKDSVTMGGAIYRTQWLHVDVVKAGTDELVWAVDGVAAGRFFEPTFLGEYDKMPVGGKSGKGETLYDQDACMYILQEERIGTTGKFGKFTFFDIEPYTTWRGWDEFGETIQ